jgi:pimeloyl-ACP methyl ester carboxylesterase
LTAAGGVAGPSPVLLIHGQPGGIRDWDRVVAAIGDRAQPIAYSRPGWTSGTSARDLAGNAAAAIEQLDRRALDRAVVVGHSFGGGVAAWLAVHHPDRVQALVLAAAAANVGALDRVDRLLAAPLVGPLATAASLTAISLALSTPALRRAAAVRIGLDPEFLAAAARLLRGPHAWRSFLIEQRALFDDLPGLEANLYRITAPTTIVTGTTDPVVSPTSSRLLATQIPSAELLTIEGAGHLLPHLHATQLADLISAAAS